MGKGAGERDARAASTIQSNLFRRYAAVGLPGLTGALSYTRDTLAQGGLPKYVEDAYGQAAAGATEQTTQSLTGLRARLAAGNPSASGGQYLSGLSQVATSGADAYSREMGQIRTSRAVAGLEQRNKLLGIVAGGGATATSLSAGFGSLGNAAIAAEPQNPAFGIGAGILSTGLGIYSQLSQPNSSSGILGFNPNASGNFNPYLNVYQGGGGTLDLTTGGGR